MLLGGLNRVLVVVVALSATLGLSTAIRAVDEEHHRKALQAIERGVGFLRATQGPDGSWSPQPGPAITAMAATVMLDNPGIKADDPALEKAIAYVLNKRREDGGIHDGFLENYNTAICLSLVSRINNRPGVAESVRKAQDYLRGLQWDGQKDPQGNTIDKDHRWYGGTGYGKEGRPDGNNLQTMVQGLYESGLDCNDPAFQRAVVFMTRLQGTPANKDFGDRIVPDGGAIYATTRSKDKLEELESKAGQVTMPDGSVRLRTYGSMTYAMFKAYLYAQLQKKDPNDQRIQDAIKWIKNNYTVEQNAGMPDAQKMQGFFNYLLVFSRAMAAWGEKTVTLADGSTRDWQNDLIDKLASMQKPDGSWTNAEADRWMEGDANLVTAYALLALQNAIR